MSIDNLFTALSEGDFQKADSLHEDGVRFFKDYPYKESYSDENDAYRVSVLVEEILMYSNVDNPPKLITVLQWLERKEPDAFLSNPSCSDGPIFDIILSMAKDDETIVWIQNHIKK